MSDQTRIGDLVEIPPVKTVIRLEEGQSRPEEIAENFVFTGEVSSHLTVIAEALISARGQGYFLQGDFGSGKSHFLASLYTWLSRGPGRETINRHHDGLARAGEQGGKILPVAISLVNYRADTTLEKIILEAVDNALVGAESDLSSLTEERHEMFNRMFKAVESAGYNGLYILIDELSEFFRSKKSAPALNEDARTLQLLGELTSTKPLWIIAAVQESIEKTGDMSQATFRKIKDRFPVKLTLSTLHIRSLISERLVRRKPGSEEEILRIFDHYKTTFPTFSSSFEDFSKTYPVHPDTISLLDGLGDLFSQHRGIVDFVYSRIAGDSRRGIPSILDRPASELLAPDSIYDHFSQRLAEFSSFNAYPRHIVPHLDKVIDRVIEDDSDLARRLIRMLVLYRIHPTAASPTAGKLAELAACSLDYKAPEMNARYVAEALLEPVTVESHFLVRRTDAAGDPRQAVFEIITEEDPGKILEARIKRAAGELQPDDSRLLLQPLLQLQDSEYWPASALRKEGADRRINWNSSQRRVLIYFLHHGDEADLPDRLKLKINTGEVDFGVILAVDEREVSCNHTAVWHFTVPASEESLDALKNFLAAFLVLETLEPANPAHAPLIPKAKERLERLRPAARQAALEAFYDGGFTDPGIRTDAAVRQLKHFDRLLEGAGEIVLAERYPRFNEVAPRRFIPSGRIYQQLLDEFIISGSLSLTEARRRSLSGAIDGLAVPLGLVELKRGSYIFSPDTSGHPLLSFLFGLLPSASTVPLAEVLEKLSTGVFGLPKDTALFLIAALAAGGLITVRRGGRAVPLEFLRMVSLEKADEIALGELISERDRTTLLAECGFLFPEWESFGLRQQREAWKEVVKFSDTANNLAEETQNMLAQRQEYTSFKSFDLPAIAKKITAVSELARSIRISYQAKEGLEGFLKAWRGTGLAAEDILFIRKLNRFLSQDAEKLIFINHYIRHDAVKDIVRQDESLAALRRQIVDHLDHPEISIVADEAKELGTLFNAFRESYFSLYAGFHEKYYASITAPALSKTAQRAIEVLKRLAGIEALDRPPGLERFLRDLLSPQIKMCSRQIREELMRAPVCGCGFQPGDIPDKSKTANPEAEVERYLSGSVEIFKDPKVLEPLTAHAYAIQDLNPEGAKQLSELTGKEGGLKASHLVRFLDEGTAGEVDRALTGRVSIHRRDLGDLVKKLSGRRLPPGRILALFSEWLGRAEEECLIAVEGIISSGRPSFSPDWWPYLQAPCLREKAPAGKYPPATRAAIERLENELEESYPSARLKEDLRRLSMEEVLRFITGEVFHSRAIQAAWQVLAERVLGGSRLPEGIALLSAHADPDKAAGIEEQLERAKKIEEVLRSPFPDRLIVRLPVDELLSDPWTGEELHAGAGKLIKETESLGESWLSGLLPVAPISLENSVLAVIIDGVSPDIWLHSMEKIAALQEEASEKGEASEAGKASRCWARLEARPDTFSALKELFGFSGDPVEELSTRGIPYTNVRGNEEHALADLLKPLDRGVPAVVRIGMIDSGAHKGHLKLKEMAARLQNILEKDLPAVIRLCREQKRRLILTTDHGLSSTPEGLRHGTGGVFERAIFRAEWAFERSSLC